MIRFECPDHKTEAFEASECYGPPHGTLKRDAISDAVIHVYVVAREYYRGLYSIDSVHMGFKTSVAIKSTNNINQDALPGL